MKYQFILYCICCFRLYSQHAVGMELNLGTSRITSASETATTLFRPSASAGVYYQFQTRFRLFISVGLSVVQVEGSERSVSPEREIQTDSGNVVKQSFESDERFHLTYLTLPVLFGLKFGRFEPAIGFQPAALIYGTFDWSGKATVNGVEHTYHAENREALVDVYDAGFVARLTYHLNDRWQFLFHYYYGQANIHGVHYLALSQIFPLGPNPWNQKVRQMTLGVKYSFWHKERRASTKTTIREEIEKNR